MVSPTHEQCSSHDNHMLLTGTRKDQELCVRLIDSTTKQVSQHTKYHISLIAEKQTDRGSAGSALKSQVASMAVL